MSVSMFVSKNHTVDVDIFVFEDSTNQIDATHDEKELPKNVDPEKVVFTFRKPSYSDSLNIIQQSSLGNKGDDVSINLPVFQSNILHNLLSSWSIKDEEGNEVEVNRGSINNLQPPIARAAVAAILEKIKVF